MMQSRDSRRLRICLVGHADGAIDEGMKKVAASLSRELSVRHDVLVFNPTRTSDLSQWRAARQFKADIVHYVPGPSWASFPLSRLLSLLSGGAPVVMTAIHPKHLGPTWIRGVFRPDSLLVQSPRVEAIFRNLQVPISYLPLGVDTVRFEPVTAAKRHALRQKYGLPPDAKIALHVGNLKSGRNLDALLPLRRDGWEVVVVGSTSVDGDDGVESTLRAAGVHVQTDYNPAIEELYQLSDLYVFPVRSATNAIEFPLSVLEAMACDIPVICTRFGGLARFLGNDKHIIWLDEDNDLTRLAAMAVESKPSTRESALEFTWQSIARQLEAFYEQTLRKKEGLHE